jgi:O-6-methylguanine DNA methyltransferase
MRTCSRFAWDVPVRLVPVRHVPVQHRAAVTDASAARTVHRIDPGIALPGVTAVHVTTRTVGGVEHVERIDPERRAGRSASTQPAPLTPMMPLADLIDRLRGPDGAVPVLVDGTPFALAVLDALRDVRAGERFTYAELAASAGRPRAVRAVASVMARNRVPLLLPCHRVVPSTGGTGRYGWGDAVKVALLDAEAVAGAEVVAGAGR